MQDVIKSPKLLLAISIAALTGCGADASTGNGGNGGNGNGSGNQTETGSGQGSGTHAGSDSDSSASESYIPYLRENHDHYSDYATSNSYPIQLEINGDQVYWDIQASTETEAENLATHIEFMGNALDNDQIPRAWDKLFVLEAFLHEQIHTDVEVDGTRVTVYKTGDNECAYELVKVHASAVSTEFFATGIISADHSSAADDILILDICADQRDAAEAFIAENWKPK